MAVSMIPDMLTKFGVLFMNQLVVVFSRNQVLKAVL